MLEKIDQQWLKSFHCVYENNSFKRAAEFLSLPTSNVSRHIALLEEQLDVRLFDRTTRRICATDAGEQLYLRTQSLLDKLNDALEEVTQHSREVMGQLNVVMPDSPELAKAVVSFCAQYPAISLNCETNLSPKEDLLDGFDVILSFHRGKLEDSNWIAKAGALAGFGFAILPVEFCHEEIESGDLEVIELEYEPEDLVLYAFYASRKHLAKKIPAFIEHLKRQANNETSG